MLLVQNMIDVELGKVILKKIKTYKQLLNELSGESYTNTTVAIYISDLGNSKCCQALSDISNHKLDIFNHNQDEFR